MTITPEQQKQYTRLSAGLQQIGHALTLPTGTTSLHLHSIDGQLYLDLYDRAGKLTETRRADQMEAQLRKIVERLAAEPCPDPDGIVCIL